MSSREHVSAVMADVGPLADLAEVSEYEDEGGLWTLLVDEATLLIADWDEAGQALVLSAEVGRPAPGDRMRLYELMLEYNGQWRESGGLVLTIDEPGGAIVQHCRINAVGLDAGRLAGTVAGFVDVLRAWREIVARASTPAEAAATRPATLPFDPFTAIRG